MPHKNFAEVFEFLRCIEVEGIAHYAKTCIIDGERDSVAVKDFAARCGKAYHSESVIVSESDIFVALIYLAEVKPRNEHKQ